MPTSSLLSFFLLLLPLPQILILSDPPFELSAKWKVPIGGDVGPITVRGDSVLFGTRSRDGSQTELQCLSSFDGTLKWRIAHHRLDDQQLENSACGIKSKPCAHPLMPIVSYFSTRGELVLADLNGQSDGDQGIADDGVLLNGGDVLWRRDLREEFGVFKRDDLEFGSPQPSPNMFGQLVVCATGNGSTHNLHQRKTIEPVVVAPEAPGWVAFPVVAGGTELVWSDASSRIVHSACASPVPFGLADDPMVFVLGGDGDAYIVSRDTGKTVSKFGEDWIWSWTNPVLGSNNIVVACASPPGDNYDRRCGIHSFNRGLADSQKLMRNWATFPATYSGTMVPPVLLNGIVFVVSTKGMLIALDEETGEILWEHPIDSYPTGYFAEMFVINEYLVVPSENEWLVFAPSRFRPTPQPLAVGIDTHAGVAVAGDVIFASDGDFIYAWTIMESKGKKGSGLVD